MEAVRRLVRAVNEGRVEAPAEPPQGPMAPPAAVGVAPVVVEPIPLSPLGPGRRRRHRLSEASNEGASREENSGVHRLDGSDRRVGRRRLSPSRRRTRKPSYRSRCSSSSRDTTVDKKISSLPYTLWVTANGKRMTSVRMGVQVPIVTTIFGATKDGATVPHVISISRRRHEHRLQCQSQADGSFNLEIKLNDSSVSFDPKDSAPDSQGSPGVPEFHVQFQHPAEGRPDRAVRVGDGPRQRRDPQGRRDDQRAEVIWESVIG